MNPRERVHYVVEHQGGLVGGVHYVWGQVSTMCWNQTPPGAQVKTRLGGSFLLPVCAADWVV